MPEGTAPPERTAPDLDLVVQGATSFVGQILCRHLVERHGTDRNLRWAIAGRNPAKLAEVARLTGAEVEAITVDAGDPDGLAELVDRTAVVISTVGPYARYGSPLVAAVAEAGRGYLDLTGEPQWIRRMIDAHQSTAESTGAHLVHSCGFDSIPSELGVWFLQQQAVARFGEPCCNVEMAVRSLRGGASGGTIASMLNLLEEAAGDPEVRRLLIDPYGLNPSDARTGPVQPEVTRPMRHPETGRWLAPFVMAAVNTKIVHRGHALAGRPWGPDFLYREALETGSGPAGAARAATVTAAMAATTGLGALGPGRALMGRIVPKPGSGPSAEAQAAGSFDLRFTGTTAGGASMTTRVTGDRDPGYGSTAKMLGETALALVEGDARDRPGGSWTPGSLLGERLVERLEAHAGLRFEVLDARS